MPNIYGGNENLEAIAFVRRLNETLYARYDGAVTIAEESTAWPMVSAPVSVGGLGFGYKWNMGWMHDTLHYFARDPIYRQHHQNDLTFGLVYAYSENYVLPLSHDEVVHGKGSLLQKMPGDRWQQFANLRLLLALMFAHPGKKLLFMGDEIAATREWNHDAQLDWGCSAIQCTPACSGWCGIVTGSIAKCRRSMSSTRSRRDFEWIDYSDASQSVLAFARKAPGRRTLIVVVNATPTPYASVTASAHCAPGSYREGSTPILNFTVEATSGTSGRSRPRLLPAHGRPQSLVLTLPPLGALILVLSPSPGSG